MGLQYAVVCHLWCWIISIDLHVLKLKRQEFANSALRASAERHSRPSLPWQYQNQLSMVRWMIRDGTVSTGCLIIPARTDNSIPIDRRAVNRAIRGSMCTRRCSWSLSWRILRFPVHHDLTWRSFKQQDCNYGTFPRHLNSTSSTVQNE